MVPDHVQQIRLSDYAYGLFPQIPTRKSLKKAIKRGEVYLNGEKGFSGHWVKGGYRIDLVDLDRPPPRIYPQKLEIIYQDAAIALINKPGGIPVSGNRFRTIQNALLYNLAPSNGEDALLVPKPVHRLDAPTFGLLLIAKTVKARIELGRQLEARQILKRYQALVSGLIPSEGFWIKEPVGGKPAHTFVELIRSVPSLKSGHISLVDLSPKTGRTHQLRIHMAGFGNPILGDKLYTEGQPLLKGKGLFLAATQLTFTHPLNGEKLEFVIDPPNKFARRLTMEGRRWGKYKI